MDLGAWANANEGIVSLLGTIFAILAFLMTLAFTMWWDRHMERKRATGSVLLAEENHVSRIVRSVGHFLRDRWQRVLTPLEDRSASTLLSQLEASKVECNRLKAELERLNEEYVKLPTVEFPIDFVFYWNRSGQGILLNRSQAKAYHVSVHYFAHKQSHLYQKETVDGNEGFEVSHLTLTDLGEDIDRSLYLTWADRKGHPHEKTFLLSRSQLIEKGHKL